jgi:hypothetical protein
MKWPLLAHMQRPARLGYRFRNRNDTLACFRPWRACRCALRRAWLALPHDNNACDDNSEAVQAVALREPIMPCAVRKAPLT